MPPPGGGDDYPATVLLLLPPSEGKTVPVDGLPLDLDSLTSTGLTSARRRVLDTLVRVSGRPDALRTLGVGPSLADEVARNTLLADAPTAPARTVYTGVLFAAGRLADLDGAALVRAGRSLRVVSALWGLVGPEDRIPAYRLSMTTVLPRLGPLAGYWRPHLATVLDPLAAERLVVDCRSAPYAAAWPLPRPVPGRTPGAVSVRVLREVDGRRTVVSHWAKHARGALVGHLLSRSGSEPATPADLLEAARELLGTGPLGPEVPGLMTSTLVDAELGPGPRGTTQLSLVVG